LAPFLSIRGLTKSYGSTKALAGLDLEAWAGEVHAVLGENGAGKSTLMAVLGGATTADAGTVRLGEASFVAENPQQAQEAGVARVHQELSLCPHLTIAENVMLGREPTRYGVLQRGELRRRTMRALEAAAGASRAGSLSPDTRVSELSPAERQLVEIARALSNDECRVLIFDEPTSSLGRDEVSVLFERIRVLREQGLTILYISHFLEEVKEIADRFTVLRDGVHVGSGSLEGTSLSQLVTMMAGKSIDKLFPHGERVARDAAEELALEVRDVAGTALPIRASFELRRGEVLGLAGLVGSGRTELLRVLFGLEPMKSGTVRALGYIGAASPGERLKQGIGMLSEDRKGEGLALSMSVADNVTLSKLPALVWARRQRSEAKHWVDVLGVRCQDVSQAVRDLSGGNQQKIALGRLLQLDPAVLLLDQPTRGIDVAAKADVYELIDRLAREGKAILLVSDDLPELLGVSDRIAVMQRGVLGAARQASEWTETSLLEHAVGGGS
jgi:ribose transport system ATP-binding protein